MPSFNRDCPPNAGSSVSSKSSAFLGQAFSKETRSQGGAAANGQHADAQDLLRNSSTEQVDSCAQVRPFFISLFKF